MSNYSAFSPVLDALLSDFPGSVTEPLSTPQSGSAPLPSSTARLDHAQVVSVDGACCVLSCGDHHLVARRAASCLLRPAMGDQVLVSRGGSRAYLLAVLERAAPEHQAAQIELNGDTQLSVTGGALTVHAEQGITLDGGPHLSLHAVDATAQFEQASLLSRVLETSGDVHRTLWREQSSICENHRLTALRAHAELGQSSRRVTGADDTVAGAMHTQVTARWSVEARVADIYAERRVSIDAAIQVQLG